MSNGTIEGAIPDISPVPAGTKRPLWSVMIPTYNCGKYLEETLSSVLAQAPGPAEMQIEVVDDCSTTDNPQEIVRALGKGRVSFFRKQSNQGAIRNFNTCLDRSIGHLVHVLHVDDTVASGYYDRISELANLHKSIGLFATRCFVIDEQSVVMSVTGRVEALETPARTPAPFFYANPIQFAGVTVRRSAYESVGGFRHELVHAADCEMWARVIASCGGIVLKDVMASYRVFAGNDTGRLIRTGENIRDLCRLYEIYLNNYPDFLMKQARGYASWMAWNQYARFKKAKDQAASSANYQVWRDITPVKTQLRMAFKRIFQRD